MHVVSGEMVTGEASQTITAISTRQRNSPWFYYLILAIFSAVGGFGAWAAAFAVDTYADREVFLPRVAVPIGVVLGSLAYGAFSRRYTLHRFKQNMAARELSVTWTQNVRLTEVAVVLEGGAVTRTANWSAVTEIFKSKAYWIFMVRMEPWFVPARFFPDAESERAFVRYAIDHLSPSARDRSAEAIRFTNVKA